MLYSDLIGSSGSSSTSTIYPTSYSVADTSEVESLKLPVTGDSCFRRTNCRRVELTQCNGTDSPGPSTYVCETALEQQHEAWWRMWFSCLRRLADTLAPSLSRNTCGGGNIAGTGHDRAGDSKSYPIRTEVFDYIYLRSMGVVDSDMICTICDLICIRCPLRAPVEEKQKDTYRWQAPLPDCPIGNLEGVPLLVRLSASLLTSDRKRLLSRTIGVCPLETQYI